MCVIRSVLLAAGLFAFAGTTQAAVLKVMGDAPLGPALSKIADLYPGRSGLSAVTRREAED